MALDPATVASGAMQLVRGSHSHGVLNSGHFADEDTLAQFPPEDTIDLVCDAGEVILLHNLTLHRSGVNTTTDPRRAISVAFIDSRSRYLPGDAAVGAGSAGTAPGGARPHGASAMVRGEFPVVFRLGSAAADDRPKL